MVKIVSNDEKPCSLYTVSARYLGTDVDGRDGDCDITSSKAGTGRPFRDTKPFVGVVEHQLPG